MRVAPAIVLSSEQKAELQKLVRRRTTPVRVAERCRIVLLAAEGLQDKQIAERLFISDITVHHHLTSIYSKLEVADRLELLIYAYRNSLAELPH